eukprot:TRINITY_DN10807_c0_g1_i4.p1 TRINITY_DN10807_c0_g1~~TRINITY_DN10807_c0_g1_i4.p1  ORF type:complete len:424 (-),score=18.37 TRINITY_DN10807_c0_g1_i4:751-2022(-)
MQGSKTNIKKGISNIQQHPFQQNMLIEKLLIWFCSLCSCYCVCTISHKKLIAVQDVFQSTTSNGSCCEVCELLDVCNVYSKCISSYGCQYQQQFLTFEECVFQYSDELANGRFPQISEEPKSQDFEYGLIYQKKNKGPIQFSIAPGQSATESIKTLDNARIFSSLTTSSNLSQQLKSNLEDPNFSAAICVPTDEAFRQFFDGNGISQGNLKSDEHALNTLMEQNIIPGIPQLPQSIGTSTLVPTLSQNEELTITRTQNMGIEVKSSGTQVAAIKYVHIDLDTDLSTWIIDQVLIPKNFSVFVQAHEQSLSQFISQQPGLNVVNQILSSNSTPFIHKQKIDQIFVNGVLYAPVDRVMLQILQNLGVNLQELLANQVLLDQFLSAIIVPDDQQPYFGERFLGKKPKFSLRADLGIYGSVFVINQI